MYDPMLKEFATERHQQFMQEAEIERLVKQTRSNRRSPWNRAVVTFAEWLIRGGQVLKAYSQPAMHPVGCSSSSGAAPSASCWRSPSGAKPVPEEVSSVFDRT